MGNIARFAGIGSIAVAATGLLAAPAQAHPAPYLHGAVFVQTDNVNSNAVVAYDRVTDGTLQRAGTYPTGGNGGVLDGSVVDHLASQGSLTYDREHRLLYAVNAGSNTITVFTVHGDRLQRRQVLSSGGDFPVSVTAHGSLVYVLNARSGGSIQGYLRIGDQLLRIGAWHRELHLDPTATPEFTSTPGQVTFTPDGRRLVVTTKANGNDIDVFDLNLFGPSARPVVTSDDGRVPFAVDFDRRGHLIAVEAGPNTVATFAMHRDGRLSLLDREATGQAASCWISGIGGRFYVSNAGSATLSGVQIRPTGAIEVHGTTATDPGTVDSAISSNGKYLYAQTGGNGIVNEFRRGADGSLTPIGSVTVPDAVGGEGIAAS
jgi:6-phosphogluconolactonase (cycloisomerase 2 family)